MKQLASLVSLCALALLVNCVAAEPITETFTFTTSGQSMWKEGSSAAFEKEKPLVAKWGTFTGGDAEDLKIGGIAGKENEKVPGTGVEVPNPSYLTWKAAYETCTGLGFSRNTCINGQSSKKVCAFGECVTVRPKVDGIGDEPRHTITTPTEFVDTRTGIETHLLTSGQIGIVPWARIRGGSIKIDLPITATFDMPETLTSGTAFTVTTGLGYESGAKITAKAPTFKAGIDGVLNMENTFTGKSCFIFDGCGSSSSDANINAGRFGIAGFDSTQSNPLQMFGDGRGFGNDPDFDHALGVPGVKFNNVYPFFFPTVLNPDGVDDPLTPEVGLTPRMGDVAIYNLAPSLSGGHFEGATLELETNQRVISLNASVTGIAENSVHSPGFLSKSFSLSIPGFPDPKIVATLADVGVGPRVGLHQEFDFTPDPWVKLRFDQPVTRVSDGKVFANGVVSFELGTDIDLRFDGEVGNLVRRTYFMKNPKLENHTSATLDNGVKIEVGCYSITVVADYDCVFTDDYSSSELVDINLYSKKWTMVGFNEIAYTFKPNVEPDPVDTSAVRDIDFDPGQAPTISVPAPSALLLLVAGLAGIGWSKRRKALTRL